MSERREFKAMPLVFMFRPTHYEVISDDRVAEWEALVAEKVGLKIDAHGTRRAILTKSYCGMQTETRATGEWEDPGCDCDQL